MVLSDTSPDFKAAATRCGIDGSLASVQKLSSDFDQRSAISLYALYKRATVGVCVDPWPTSDDVFVHTMHHRWRCLKGLSPKNAQLLFVKGVKKLYREWPLGTRGSTVEPITKTEMQKRNVDSWIDSATLNETGIREKKAHDKVPERKGLSSIHTDNHWTSTFVYGRIPKPRYQHGSVTMQNKMYVFGGNDGESDLDDFRVLDLKNYKWSKLEPKAAKGTKKSSIPVRSRAGHTLILWNDKIVSVAGLSKDLCDTIIVEEFDMASCTWRSITTHGRPPTCRGGQSATLVGSHLVIFGGEDANKSPLGDLHILDMNTMEWDNCEDIGNGPSPRSYHSAAGHADAYVFIFGGKCDTKVFNDLHILDLHKREWFEHDFKGKSPCRRACHASVTVGDNWFIVGGWVDGHGVLETMLFNMSTRVWSILTYVNGPSSLASEGLSLVSTVYEGKCFLVSFGGRHRYCSYQIFVLRLKYNTDGHTHNIESNPELSEAALDSYMRILFPPPNFSVCGNETGEVSEASSDQISESSDSTSELDVSPNREAETLQSQLNFDDTEGNETNGERTSECELTNGYRASTSVENRSKSLSTILQLANENNQTDGKETSEYVLRNGSTSETSEIAELNVTPNGEAEILQRVLNFDDTEGDKTNGDGTSESELTNGNRASTCVENRSTIPQLANVSKEDNHTNGKETSEYELRNCNRSRTSDTSLEKSTRQQSIGGETVDPKRGRSPNFNKLVSLFEGPAHKKSC